MTSQAPEVQLRRIELAAFEETSAGLNLLVCQTPQWLSFLQASQGAEPVLAEVVYRGERHGIFTGAILRKVGLSILGSPLRGWTTSYMGFALQADVPQSDLLAALKQFAFTDLKCAHVEILDRRLQPEPGWQHSDLHGYEIDLRLSEDQLFANMTSACRRCIRKAEGVGLTIEAAGSADGFAAEYYAQATEVFARKGLAPPYSQQRVEQLIAALHPGGMLLLLRARDPQGRCIATSMFPRHCSMMYFWGGASVREGLLNRPNEAMIWYALRYWKGRGAVRFDMGGGGEYKAKYGGVAISVPWLRCSRNPAVGLLRSGAERVLRARQRLRARRKRS